MQVKNSNSLFLRFAILAAGLMLSLGCVNLDKRNPAPFRFGQKTNEGQTVATQAAIKTPVNKMNSVAKPSSLAKKVKHAWPLKRKAKMTVKGQPIAKDDPTRLDYVPKDINADLYIASAKMAEKVGDVPKAFEQYKLALSKDGSNRNALIGLARLQHRTGNTQAAIQIYREALDTHRKDAVMMNDLGICYAQTQQLDESIAMLQAATKAAPDREMYLNNLAAALVDADRTQEAFSYLAQRRGPAMAHYNIGYLLNKSGRQADADSHLRQALQLQPELDQARALLQQQSPVRVSSLPNPQDTMRRYDGPVRSSQEASPPPIVPHADFGNVNGSEDVLPPVGYMPQNTGDRVGPFGFVPQGEAQKVHVVSYVEEID